MPIQPVDPKPGIARWILLPVVVALGLLSLWCCASNALIPDTRRAHRGELPGNVDAIRAAELAWHATTGQYLALPLAPRAVSALGKQAVPWTPTPDWTALAWQPDGPVRGAYWVVLTPTGFEVHATCDVDGDGVRAEYMASESQNAHIVTPVSVY